MGPDLNTQNKTELEPSRFQKLLRLAIGVPILVGVFSCALLVWQIEDLVSNSAWVDHTDRVIGTTFELQKMMLDAETGVRGFYAAGRSEFLEPYEKAIISVPKQIQELRELVADNPDHVKRMETMETRWKSWLAWEQELIDMKRAGQEVSSRLQTMNGKVRMDQIRADMDQFRVDEENLRKERVARMNSSHRYSLFVVLGLILAVASFVIYFTRQSFYNLSRAYSGSMAKLKLASQDLYESREWFSTSLSSIGDAVIAVDVQSRISFMNPIAEKLTGWKSSEAAGRPMLEVFNIINEETRKPAFNPVNTVLEKGIIVGLANHTVLIAKDGHEMPIEDSAAPIRVENGDVRGVILVFRDVTEKHFDKRRLEILNQDLKESLVYRDEFLSIASHELKTPLTSLKLQLQMNERSFRPGAVDEHSREQMADSFALAIRQVNSLTGLVEDLLDISRIQAGKLTLNLDEMNFADLVREVVDRFSEQLKSVNCTVELELPERLVGRWDRHRIEQVIVNLLSNAIKYASKKPILISAVREGQLARIIIADSGPGIAKDKQVKIFERFERAASSKNVGGMGLGLYIVKKIVDAHGGVVRVESELGKGAKFIVELPLAPVPVVEHAT